MKYIVSSLASLPLLIEPEKIVPLYSQELAQMLPSLNTCSHTSKNFFFTVSTILGVVYTVISLCFIWSLLTCLSFSIVNILNYICVYYFCILKVFLKKPHPRICFYCFLEGEEREREKQMWERNINMLSPVCAHTGGLNLQLRLCALTGNRAQNLLVNGALLQPTKLSSQDPLRHFACL